MKKIVITIIMFAIAIALIVGVIIPLANHGKTMGAGVETNLQGIGTSINALDDTIH